MQNKNDSSYKSGFVAVVGQPNVGKSTLINALIGQKIAAVSPRPQTTRKQQLGILSLVDAQIIFTDTPGLHQARHKLGALMNEQAAAALENTDAVLFVVDAQSAPNDNDHNLAALIKTLKNPPPIILALNKIDLLDDEAITQSQLTYQELLPTALALPISAARSLNLGQLLEALLNHIPVSPPFYPEEQVTDLYERDIAADLIREATLRILKDEIPHGIAVRVDEYTERDDHGAYIEATLFVERDSQKGIVIGKAGAMLKQIGTTARQEIERMSGRKVFLRLRVKVRKNWRNDENFLRQFDFKKRKK